MTVKFQTLNSKKNMGVLRRLLAENPGASRQKILELMILNGCVGKMGKPLKYNSLYWMMKKIKRTAKSKAKPADVKMTAKTAPKGGDKMDLITLVMAANIPDYAKLDVVKVLANVP